MLTDELQAESVPQAAPLYIVTGATDALGSVITRRLAQQGKAVLLASRDIEKAERYAQQLTEKTKNKDLSCLQLDLSSFAQVRDFVERLKALDRPIVALINNAGTLPRHSRLSPDGYEHTIQVNFLSTALLSLLVYPLMEEDGKILLSTSVSRRFVSLPYEFPAVSHFTQIGAFAQSKLALALFSIYMSTTMKTRRVHVNCVNPGVIKTSLIAMHRWIDSAPDYFLNNLPDPEAAVIPMMRALESDDTGFIFSGKNKQVKTSSMLDNREVFIKLCNDTMRILKKQIP